MIIYITLKIKNNPNKYLKFIYDIYNVLKNNYSHYLKMIIYEVLIFKKNYLQHLQIFYDKYYEYH